MNKIMTYDNLRNFTYVNDKICTKPIKGIVLSFFGLGGMTMYPNETVEGEFYAEQGILYVVPYNNPWAWMNKQSVAYTDEILDVLFSHYNLDENTPIISTGGSMGGLAALVYMVYAKRTPTACVANCPVCDAVYHYTERPDLPRTMYSALYNEQCDLDTALKSISPIHLAEKMPKVPYYIFHCDEDKSVNLHKHSEAFINEMKKYDYNITFNIVPGRGHCDLPYNMKKLFAQYAIDEINKGV